MTLCIDSIVFSYPGNQVLNGISTRVKKGSICAILGGNGCGKTTLLNCINKLLTIGAGTISIENNNLADLTIKETAKLISYVPQEHDNIFPYPVIEVVVMGRTPYLGIGQSPSDSDYAEANRVLDKLGAKYLSNLCFNKISGGERQIAMIARALIQKSPIMVLDEPTNHLDFSKKFALMRLLKKISIEEQKTIITTTHDPNLIYSVADQVIMLKDGRIFADGPPKETLNKESLLQVYGVNTTAYSVDDNNLFFYAN